MKKKIMSIVLIAVMMLCFGMFAMGSGSNGNSSTDNSKENAIGTKENPLTVGSTLETKNLKVTLDSVDLNYQGYDKSYGFYDPKAGMKYVATTFTFENIGNNDEYVSIYDFKCYADGTAAEQTYGLESDKSGIGSGFINTNLSSGRKVSFTTYYSVPEGAQSIELEFEANALSGKKSYIKLQ